MKKGLIKKKKNDKKACCSHLFILLLLFVIAIWDRIINVPKFPTNFLYLTQIDLYLSILYFLLMLLVDMSKKESKKQYQKLFNFSFTLSFIVFVMFWSMLLFIPESLYGNVQKPPIGLLASLHGGVFICNLLEQLVIVKRKNPKFINQLVYFVFTIVYIGALSIIYYLFELKVYPFIYGSMLSFFIVCLGGFLCSLIGHRIYICMTGGPGKKKIDLSEDIGNESDESLNNYNE